MIDDAARARLARAIGTAITDYLADGAVPGLSMAVIDSDGLALELVSGSADLARRRPVTGTTLFEIGSIGKSFAAAILMQLTEEGRLDPSEPVVRHLPWFSVPRTGSRITLHHLLSHTAGITTGIDATPEAVCQVWRLRSLRPGSAPGRRFHYSNVGYKALGLVIEAIEEEPYLEVLRRRILDPLGMRQSEPAITSAIRPRLAVGYEALDPATPQLGLAEATWLETATADGAIASTASELANFLRMLMRAGDVPDGRFLSARSVERMMTPVEARNSEGFGYGLQTTIVGGRRFVGHGGGMVGYRSGMAWDPALGIGAVVLQNASGKGPLELARLAIRMASAVTSGQDPEAQTIDATDARPDPTDGPRFAPRGVATEQLDEICGVYRSHNPWTDEFRIKPEGAIPWLIFTSPPNGFRDRQPLARTARDYRVGADRLGPERIKFDTVIGGKARRAWLSGWDYYRVGDG